ncbi:MAG: DASS family sodium-coupled anion symporter [Planctomycetes bacterium]|nr:DASS family sodium-coupled anion symporter [Planctomycetota bacterium]
MRSRARDGSIREMEETIQSTSAAQSPKTPWVSFLLGPVLFGLGIGLLETTWYSEHEGLHPASAAFGLMLWMAWWWLKEVVPLAVTSLLPLVILPLTAVTPAAAVAPKYFSDTIALFFGGFCLALALEYTGLHRKLVAFPMRIVKGRPRRAVLVLLLSAGALSMWVSNTATTLALLPIALAVAKELDPESSRGLAPRLVLAVAFGAAIGGIGTIVGTPPNAFLQAFYNDHFSKEIAAGELQALTFGRWMIIGVPIVLLLLPCAAFLLTRGLAGVEVSSEKDPEVPHFGRKHKLVMGVFAITVLAWITRAPISFGEAVLPLTGWGSWFGSKMISDGTIAMFAALTLMAIPFDRGSPLLPWSFAVKRLPWDALLLFGGGLALAAGLDSSGLAKDAVALFDGLSGMATGGGIAIIVVLVLVSMTLFSEFSSNTAAAAIAIPLLASLGGVVGEPMLMLLAGTLGASCGYALPVATPPNTIAYASGAVSVREMIRNGVLLDLCAVGVMFLVIWLLGSQLD